MHARLAKEARPLAFPTILGFGVIALVHMIGPRGAPDYTLWMAWMVSASLLASSAFAVENENRNWALLLSQPISRWRIWWEKYRVLVPLAVTMSVFYANILHALSRRLSWDSNELVLGYCSVVASLASAPFWATVGRTTLGATVLGFGSQVAVLMVSFTALELWNGAVLVAPSALFLGTTYSLLFLFLGWRRHSRAEAVERQSTAKPVQDGPWSIGSASSRHRWWNLVLRELNLQRGTLLLAGVFLAITGLTAFLAVASRPFQMVSTTALIPLCGIWSVITLLFVTSAALCEEHVLGTQAWSLTLPVSGGSQFLVKLGTAIAVFLVFGLALPFGVFVGLSQFAFPSILRTAQNLPLFQLGAGLVALFAVSVRLAVSSKSPLQAVLTTISILGVILVGLVYINNELIRETLDLMAPRTYGQIPRDSFWWRLGAAEHGNDSTATLIAWAIGVPLMLGLLWLAFRAHRHLGAGDSRGIAIGSSVAHSLALFTVVILAYGLEQHVIDRQQAEVKAYAIGLRNGIGSLGHQTFIAGPGAKREYTVAELEATGLVDPRFLSRLTAPNQRIVVRDIASAPRPSGLLITVTAQFVPPVSFPENLHRSYRSLGFVSSSWTEITEKKTR
jgi:hypothetical protein